MVILTSHSQGVINACRSWVYMLILDSDRKPMEYIIISKINPIMVSKPHTRFSTLATALGGEKWLWDLGVMISQPRAITWSELHTTAIYPAVSAQRHVLMSSKYKNNIHVICRWHIYCMFMIYDKTITTAYNISVTRNNRKWQYNLRFSIAFSK